MKHSFKLNFCDVWSYPASLIASHRGVSSSGGILAFGLVRHLSVAAVLGHYAIMLRCALLETCLHYLAIISHQPTMHPVDFLQKLTE